MSWISDIWHDTVVDPIIKPVEHAVQQLDKSLGGNLALITAASLIAAGIYDPELLSLAEDGALTTDALASSGASGTQIASLGNVAGLSPASLTSGQLAGLVNSNLMTPSMVGNLLSGGASIANLVGAGAPISALLSGGASVASMMATGVTVSNLLSAGASVAVLLGAKAPLVRLLAAGASVSDLVNNGVSAGAILSTGAIAAGALGQKDLAKLLSVGASVNGLIRAGSNINKILDANKAAIQDTGKPVLTDKQVATLESSKQLNNGTIVDSNGRAVDPDTGNLTQPWSVGPKVTLPDGTVGYYSAKTGDVYNSDGSLNDKFDYNTTTGKITSANPTDTTVDNTSVTPTGPITPVTPTLPEGITQLPNGNYVNADNLIVDPSTGNLLHPSSVGPSVTLPDGTTGYFSYKTGDVYNSDGSLNQQFTEAGGKIIDTAKASSIDVAQLEPAQQKIVNDSQQGYLSGKLTWEQASAAINKAVQSEINSGYLKSTGDGNYVAPDGVVYNFNNTTGMWDTKVGETGGTGTAPVTPPVDTTPPVTTPVTTPVTPPVDTTPPVTTPVTPPVDTTPPVTTPVTPPVDTTPPVVTSVTPPTNITPTPLPPVTPPTTTPVTPPNTQPTVTNVEHATNTDGNPMDITHYSDGTFTITFPQITKPVTPTPPPTDTTTTTTPPPVVTQPPVTEIPTITVTAPKDPVVPVEKPPVVIPNPPVVTPPVVTPPKTDIPELIDNKPPVVPVEPPVIKIPTDTSTTKTPTTGHYTWGTPYPLHLAEGLNPGWINPPEFYHNTNPAQAKYYWGQHPFQPGQTFNSELYNTVPNAPATPWGSTYAQTAATPEQILAAMEGRYPLLGTTGVNGPVVPTK